MGCQKKLTFDRNAVATPYKNHITRFFDLTFLYPNVLQKPEAKGEIADINTELKELRAKVRMCNNILIDSERINEKYNEAQRLEQEAELERSKKNKPKIKTKDQEITR